MRTAKVFSQRLYLGNGKWRYKLDGLNPTLYHEEMLWYAQTVVITEGEKDADTVNALLATDLTVGVTSGGATSWHPSLAKLFKAQHRILIAPDDDAVGEQFGVEIAKSLDEERIPYRSLSFTGTGCKDTTEFAERHGADAFSIPDIVVPKPLAMIWSVIKPASRLPHSMSERWPRFISSTTAKSV